MGRRARSPLAALRMASLGHKWLSFGEWLRQQRGSGEGEAASEAGTAVSEDGDAQLEAPAPQSASGQADAAASQLVAAASSSSPPTAAPAVAGPGSGGGGEGRGGSPPPAAPPRPQLRPLLADCRCEMRMASECSRARQEALVMLAAPGMPLHRAPVLTARQAQALIAAVSEPLVSINAGRLTRRLAAPTRLEPTAARGKLSLWLLPSDDLVLTWQETTDLPPAEAEPQACAAGGEPGGGRAADGAGGSGGAEAEAGADASASLPAAPACREAATVSVWEELAHFPTLCHLAEDSPPDPALLVPRSPDPAVPGSLPSLPPVVTIHMLRGDASGRSFYVRVRDDVAAANVELALAVAPAAGGAASPGDSAAGPGRRALAPLDGAAQPPPRLYFWLTDADVARALACLGRLKSLLKRPPTLSRRSGVPEQQLAQVAGWLRDVEAHQQRQAQAEAQAAAAEQQAAERLEGAPDRPAAPAAAGGPLSPGALLGRSRSPAAVACGLRALLCPPAPPGAAGGGAAAQQQQQQEAAREQGEVSAAASASASALAVYQDMAFGGGVVVPVHMSVTVTVALSAAGGGRAVLAAAACDRARAAAEARTKAAVDASGRQQVECRLAELLVARARQQRQRARMARQEVRRIAARRAAANESVLLLRAAEARNALARTGCGGAQAETAGGDAAPAPGPAATAGAFAAFTSSSSTRADAPTRGVSVAAVADGGGAADSTAPAPLPAPAAARSGQVTIDNLTAVLQSATLDGGAPGAAAAAAGGAAQGQPGAGGRQVSVTDLAELLRRQDSC
eukprot:scaffold20.g7900.t1